MPFSSAGADIPANAVNRLKAAARHPCQYVIYRPVSPVFDIFSLGAIGLRLLATSDRGAVADLIDDVFELATLLPKGEGVEGLQRLSSAPEISERCRNLFKPPAWATVGGDRGESLPENVWLAILLELVEFVAAETPQSDPPPPEGPTQDSPAWLDRLAERVASLDQLAAQVRSLLLSPRVDRDEVARIVHSFV